MKIKKLVYVSVPALVLVGVLGAGAASAHGLFEGLGGFGALSPDDLASRHQAMFQQKASLLGIGVEEMKNAWAEGKTLQQISQDKGISQEDLQKRVQEAKIQQMKTQLQTLVDKGVITQAQADKRLQAMQTWAQNGIGRKGMMKFHW